GAGEVGLDPALERGLPASRLLYGEHLLRQGTRPLDQVEIDYRIDSPELGKPMLRRAQELARAAELQILLGQLLAVLAAPENLEPLPRRFTRPAPEQENAPAGTLRPPYPPAQLVELRQAEPLRVLDHDERCVGDVEPHLDDGRGDQDARVARAEPLDG